jgi:glutathione synthase/RimK-type ligase-like ATP-grasp enzyme
MERLLPLKLRYLNPPRDIWRMFDKVSCNLWLHRAGISVPPIVGYPRDFDDLIAMMRAPRCPRVFLKPRYSSSASGIVAIEIGACRQQAFSTVEMVRADGELKLYNSRRVRRYEKLAELRELIDTLCREAIYLERWLPKAGIEGRRFDLRVMVIGGKARQVVVRTSEHPMTNLHLGARRGDLGALQETMGDEDWSSAMATAEKAMTIFPQSLYGGIDLLVSPGWKKHAVLEINAFGDLLPHVLWQGMDTYALELKTWLEFSEGS